MFGGDDESDVVGIDLLERAHLFGDSLASSPLKKSYPVAIFL